MTDDLGHVLLDPSTLRDAEHRREADLASCVVTHAKVLTASQRVRARLAAGEPARRLLTWPRERMHR